MASPLTLENRLILACARTEPDVQHIQALVARGPDWQAILRKTERWGLAPLVYTHLRQAVHSGHVPKPVAERLRHLYHRDTIHDVARRELLRVDPAAVCSGERAGHCPEGGGAGNPRLSLAGVAPDARHRSAGAPSRDRDRVEAVLRSLRDRTEPDAPSGPPTAGPQEIGVAQHPPGHFQCAECCRRAASGGGAFRSKTSGSGRAPVQIEAVDTLGLSLRISSCIWRSI